jgi:hypothetical protein
LRIKERSEEVGSGGKIITPALPGGSACPLILRGQFMRGIEN